MTNLSSETPTSEYTSIEHDPSCLALLAFVKGHTSKLRESDGSVSPNAGSVVYSVFVGDQSEYKIPGQNSVNPELRLGNAIMAHSNNDAAILGVALPIHSIADSQALKQNPNASAQSGLLDDRLAALYAAQSEDVDPQLVARLRAFVISAQNAPSAKGCLNGINTILKRIDSKSTTSSLRVQ